MDDTQRLQARVAELEAKLLDLQQTLAERDSRIQELEEELRRRGKNYRPKPNRKKPPAGRDRRRRPHRQHRGFFREIPQDIPEEQLQHHDVFVETCPCCGGQQLKPTGDYCDHIQAEIPEPKVEYHRFRRHWMECQNCGKRSQGRGDLELPGSHIGPRTRLLVCYARGHLGISLGKTCALLQELWGLSLSRAGALGHLRWGSRLMAPVVQQFLELLKQSPVVHADETGWRINGKNVWTWCFSNRDLAVFLIRHSRGRQVLIEALGESLPGVLVTDFYAAYNRMKAEKQRCLAHLLRELHELSQRLPRHQVATHIRPLITLFQDAIDLGRRRADLSQAAFAEAREEIYERFGECVTRDSRNKDVRRIYKRLLKHVDELLTFLERPDVPPDNNLGERDIRSVTAARSDGGVNRAEWGATAFGNIKSVVRTCQKRGVSFLRYGLQLVQATLAGQPPPLPLADG